MTTLKSVFEHSPATLTIENNIRPGEVYFHARPDGDCIVLRSEVLEALDATANADVKHRADVYAQLNETEAKLAEAEAAIQRVKAAIASERERLGRQNWNSIVFSASHHSLNAVEAALTPPKPFELPTTVPARIEVRHRATNTRDELVLWTDGTRQTWWDTEDSSEYTPEQVMADFTGHRLLDNEQES